MKVIDVNDQNSIKKSAEILSSGGVLIFPTDTVYGIGCSLNNSAILKLYKIKNRPQNKPTSILISNKHSLILCSSIKKMIKDNIINDFKNGETTLIIDTQIIKMDISKIIEAHDTIGVRIPNDEWLQKLIIEVGPIVASSANKAGESVPKSFACIDPDLLAQVDLVIKTDQIIGDQPSRVYDTINQKYLR